MYKYVVTVINDSCWYYWRPFNCPHLSNHYQPSKSSSVFTSTSESHTSTFLPL